jgi:endoglucanase
MIDRHHPGARGRFRRHGRSPLALLALGAGACLFACLAIFDPSFFDRSSVPAGGGAAQARFQEAQTLAAQAPAAQALAAAARAGAGQAVVRVNQVGFPPGAPKTATAMAQAPLRGRAFRVLDSRGRAVLKGVAGRDRGGWNRRWRHTYPLDFSAVNAPGVYTIALVAGGHEIRSSPFGVGVADYATLAAREVSFLREQRDGPEVDHSLLGRMPSHLEDAHALIYETPRYRGDVLSGGLRPAGGGPVNVAGGWADAGDYVKFVETASFAEDLLLYTLREHPAALGAAEPQLMAEARYGLEWLGRMWDQSMGVLRYQVGIGNGNQRVEGDHDVGWRLPQHDDTLRVRPGRGAYFVRYRPVFQTGTGGTPLSPNLAGRLAAAFGLCAQVFRATDPAYAHQCLLWGQTIFDRAATHPQSLVTTTPFNYYPEREWQDDMELGAAELLRATATTADRGLLPHPDPLYWFEQADHWGQAYMEGPLDGTDTFNLYDVAPLAHLELMEDRQFAPAPAVARMRSDQTAVLADLRDQLSAAKRAAAHDPFGIGYAYADDDTVSHLLGLSLQARFYDRIAGTHTYVGFAQRQLDAVLGANAWGLSFVVGAGSRFPVCLHHQVANLSGSLNGHPPLLLGAVVPGPVSARELRGLSAAEGYRRCPSRGGNPYAQFSGRGAGYQDNVLADTGNEPSDDLAALALLALASEAGG